MRLMDTVVFDMDGLMFDTERLWMEAFDYGGRKMGLGPMGYMVIRTLGMNEQMWQQVFMDEFGDSFSREELMKYSREYLNEFYSRNRTPVKKGLYNLLDTLEEQGYTLAVASSSPLEDVTSHLRDAGIEDRFSVIVTGDMVERSKPEPEIYLKACGLLGKKPQQCYAIEDSPGGIVSAHTAGLRALLVPDLWQPEKEYADIYYRMFADLDEVALFFKSSEC